MKATRGNKVYTIDETQKAMYQAQGYDIIDDEGNLLQYGAGKTVSYEEYKELEKKNKELEEKLKKLEAKEAKEDKSDEGKNSPKK
jgi:cell shape-determining protein MreC